MAANRSSDQILDQMVYAVACVAAHYGPGLSEDGLRWVREQLRNEPSGWGCDSSWRVDVLEGDGEPDPDFCPSVLPPTFMDIEFGDVVRRSGAAG